MTSASQSGFSLIELLCALGLAAILGSIATTAMLMWIPNIHLDSAARDIYNIFAQAKMEAVKNNSNYTVTFNQNIGAKTFQIVLFQDNNPANFKYDPAETIVFQLENLPSRVMFDTGEGGGDGLDFNANSDGNPSVTFRPNTIPTDSTGNFLNGTVFLVNSKGNKKNISINQAGFLRINQ